MRSSWVTAMIGKKTSWRKMCFNLDLDPNLSPLHSSEVVKHTEPFSWATVQCCSIVVDITWVFTDLLHRSRLFHISKEKIEASARKANLNVTAQKKKKKKQANSWFSLKIIWNKLQLWGGMFYCFSLLTLLIALAKPAKTTAQLTAHRDNHGLCYSQVKTLCLITGTCSSLWTLFGRFLPTPYSLNHNLFLLDRRFLLLPLEVHSPLQI